MTNMLETTQGNPMCDLCGNDAMTMLLYSEDESKSHNISVASDPATDHYACADCRDDGEVPETWYFVR